jgi:hypothetical protein
MAAAGGAGSGAAAAAPGGEDRYGDVLPRFRMGAQIENDSSDLFTAGNAGRYIKLNPEALTWDRYFIYKHAFTSHHPYGGHRPLQATPKIDGLLIDNYGQSYFINMLLAHDNNFLKTDIILTPDNEHFQKLTNAQIDYVKGIANTLEKNGFDLKTIGLSNLFADIDLVKKQMHELSAVRQERNELQGRINTATRSFARLQANIAARNRTRAAPVNNDPRAAPRRQRNTRRSRK